MKVIARRFNLFLAVLALTAFCGCRSWWSSQPNKPVAALRVHIEVPRLTATGRTVSVLRASPVLVNVSDEPVLTEASIAAARIINAHGGFAIEIQFNEDGAWILEQYSAGNPGKHFAIFGQWGEKLQDGRWLAAPLITHRISDGVLTFTPDMSRTEADQLVLGLNNVVKNIRAKKLQTSQ